LYFDAFDADRDQVIARAGEFGVKYLINVGTDPATNAASFEIASKYEFIFHTAGLHPHYAGDVSQEGLKELWRFVKEKKPVAIGEIGLDTFKSQTDLATQKKIFVHMIGLALENNLPVIVHSREAFKETLEILKSEGRGKLKGVMHCFSYDEHSLKELLDIGFLASFTCNLTFKNAGALLEVAKKAPLERIMLETDSPYLAPQVYRGKRNEPSCLTHLAQFLAQKRGIERAELEKVTSKTAIDFFNLGVAYE
jgi:TatD DNase family protein